MSHSNKNKYICPECCSNNWKHLGEGELKCLDCNTIAGAEYFEERIR